MTSWVDIEFKYSKGDIFEKLNLIVMVIKSFFCGKYLPLPFEPLNKCAQNESGLSSIFKS